MDSREIELFLTRLYTENELYERFITDPRFEIKRQQLSADVACAFEAIDIQGLKLAARGYRHKRDRAAKISLSVWCCVKNYFSDIKYTAAQKHFISRASVVERLKVACYRMFKI
jgi:hypothetical protein